LLAPLAAKHIGDVTSEPTLGLARATDAAEIVRALNSATRGARFPDLCRGFDAGLPPHP
jgi:hypothetical protein